jgi:hypothetical protein
VLYPCPDQVTARHSGVQQGLQRRQNLRVAPVLERTRGPSRKRRWIVCIWAGAIPQRLCRQR